ncbi:MAG: fimbria/pilus periplasmic chaperone [Usitatibacteraceae bacterium]
MSCSTNRANHRSAQSLPGGRCRAAASWLAALALLAGPHADAGSLAVSPLKLVYTKAAGIISVSVQNDGNAEALVQAETFLWKQTGSEHVLTPTEDVIAVPPVFKLAAGAQQSVRVGLTRAFDEKQEQTFRLTVTEVPTAIAQGTIAVAVRHSLPIFIRPSSVIAPKLVARFTQDGVELSNAGGEHLRIHRWRIRNSAGAIVSQGGGPGYLLAGAALVIPAAGRAQPGPAVFEADCDDATLKIAVGQ